MSYNPHAFGKYEPTVVHFETLPYPMANAPPSDVREYQSNEASCITVGLFDTDSGVKRCEYGARSLFF